MYFIVLALGAVAGVLIVGRFVLCAIILAVASLVFLGLHDHVFDDVAGGLWWLMATLACFEVGLVLGGLAITMFQTRRPQHRARFVARADEN